MSISEGCLGVFWQRFPSLKMNVFIPPSRQTEVRCAGRGDCLAGFCVRRERRRGEGGIRRIWALASEAFWGSGRARHWGGGGQGGDFRGPCDTRAEAPPPRQTRAPRRRQSRYKRQNWRGDRLRNVLHLMGWDHSSTSSVWRTSAAAVVAAVRAPGGARGRASGRSVRPPAKGGPRETGPRGDRPRPPRVAARTSGELIGSDSENPDKIRRNQNDGKCDEIGVE